MHPSELVVLVLSVLWIGVVVASLVYWRKWRQHKRGGRRRWWVSRATVAPSDWQDLAQRTQHSQIDALRGWMGEDHDLVRRQRDKAKG